MNSEGIKQKQLELVAVLFKKANGISTITPKQSVYTSSLKPSVNNSVPALPVIKSGSSIQKLASDTNQNNGGFGLGLNNVDWGKMKNDTINLIKNHKLETLGGAGGLVLGSLFGGNSFTERMLMAGLGALAGGGLGHLVSKYKNQ